MKKLFCGALVAVLFAACAGNPPANDNGSVREKAENAYSEGQNSAPVAPQTSSEAPSAPLSTVAFKNAPTVLVTPALSGRMAASIDVVRNNPFAKTAMETINSYLTSRGYTVVGLESQAQLDEVIQLQSDIAGNDEDLSYVAGLSVGADISITYAGSIQENDIVVDLNASEASTANLLASESVRQKKEGGQSQRVLVQRAMESAIVNLENKIGSPAIIDKNAAPSTVRRVKTFVIYSFVSSPGLIPGIYPPFSCKFFANSSGFN